MPSDNHYDACFPGLEPTQRWLSIENEKGLTWIPIIALTANALASNIEDARAAGMDDVLTKPCTLDKLEAMVNRWLDKPADKSP